MSSLEPRRGGYEPLDGEFVFSHTIVAELQCLPSARAFPPNFKRGRCGFLGGDGEAAAAGTLPGGRNSRLAAQAALDSTGYLLMAAANQLSNLVERRRLLRMSRRGLKALVAAVASDSAASSDAEDGDDDPKQQQQQSLNDPSQLCSSMGGADSMSVTSASMGGTSGATSQLPSTYHAEPAGTKQPWLQHQDAIDLSGHCLLDDDFLPLPASGDATSDD